MQDDWARGLKPVPPGPDNPLGTRWMGLSAPGVGIHGTDEPTSIGYSASHGCIRMQVPDAEWLFDHVDVGHDRLHRLMRAVRGPSPSLRWSRCSGCSSGTSRTSRTRASPRRSTAVRRSPPRSCGCRRIGGGPELDLACVSRQGRRPQLLGLVVRRVQARGEDASRRRGPLARQGGRDRRRHEGSRRRPPERYMSRYDVNYGVVRDVDGSRERPLGRHRVPGDVHRRPRAGKVIPPHVNGPIPAGRLNAAIREALALVSAAPALRGRSRRRRRRPRGGARLAPHAPAASRSRGRSRTTRSSAAPGFDLDRLDGPRQAARSRRSAARPSSSTSGRRTARRASRRCRGSSRSRTRWSAQGRGRRRHRRARVRERPGARVQPPLRRDLPDGVRPDVAPRSTRGASGRVRRRRSSSTGAGGSSTTCSARSRRRRSTDGVAPRAALVRAARAAALLAFALAAPGARCVPSERGRPRDEARLPGLPRDARRVERAGRAADEGEIRRRIAQGWTREADPRRDGRELRAAACSRRRRRTASTCSPGCSRSAASPSGAVALGDRRLVLVARAPAEPDGRRLRRRLRRRRTRRGSTRSSQRFDA